MIKLITAVALSLSLLGCATASDKAAASRTGDRATYEGDAGYRTAQPNAGQWAVAVIGTPFYLAFKTAVCGASLVVAAPTAAMLALADSPYGSGVSELGDGVATNCGPPYVLSPS